MRGQRRFCQSPLKLTTRGWTQKIPNATLRVNWANSSRAAPILVYPISTEVAAFNKEMPGPCSIIFFGFKEGLALKLCFRIHGNMKGFAFKESDEVRKKKLPLKSLW